MLCEEKDRLLDACVTATDRHAEPRGLYPQLQLRTIARLSGKRWRTPNRPDRMRRRQDWRCTCIQKLMAAELSIYTQIPKGLFLRAFMTT
jgi:hypothetical protein